MLSNRICELLSRILWRPYKSHILFAFHFTDFSFILFSSENSLWIDNFSMQYLLFNVFVCVWIIFAIYNLCTMYHLPHHHTNNNNKKKRNSMWNTYVLYMDGCFNTLQNIALLDFGGVSRKMIWDIWIVKLSHSFKCVCVQIKRDRMNVGWENGIFTMQKYANKMNSSVKF